MERRGTTWKGGNEDGETGAVDAGGPGRDDPGRERDEVQRKAWRGDSGKSGNDDAAGGGGDLEGER